MNHHPSLAFNPSALGVPGSVRSGLTPLLKDAHADRLAALAGENEGDAHDGPLRLL